MMNTHLTYINVVWSALVRHHTWTTTNDFRKELFQGFYRRNVTVGRPRQTFILACHPESATRQWACDHGINILDG
jgi:hypothetical protein